MSKAFVIEAVGVRQPPLYWSNDWGRGDRDGATVFSAAHLVMGAWGLSLQIKN